MTITRLPKQPKPANSVRRAETNSNIPALDIQILESRNSQLKILHTKSPEIANQIFNGFICLLTKLGARVKAQFVNYADARLPAGVLLGKKVGKTEASSQKVNLDQPNCSSPSQQNQIVDRPRGKVVLRTPGREVCTYSIDFA